MLKNFRLKKLQDRFKFIKNLKIYIETTIDNFEAYKHDQKIIS